MQISKLNVDLVIFDCDGVLVDSEVISCRAHAETLTRHGYPITSDEVLDRFLGVSDHEARLIVEAELGRSLPGDFEAQIRQAALQCYADHLAMIPYGGSHCRPGYRDTLRAAEAPIARSDRQIDRNSGLVAGFSTL